MRRALLLLACVASWVASTCSSQQQLTAAVGSVRRGLLGRSSTQQLSGVPSFVIQQFFDTDVPACAFSSITGTCGPTDNYLLRAATGDTLKNATFHGRAHAFTVAAAAYCGWFPRKSCAYPCSDNGEVCALHGALASGIYACDGTQAQADAFCSLAPLSANTNLCLQTSACLASPQDARPSRQCTAKFKANFTAAQSSQFMSDWSTTRRSVWGCCQGSQARYTSGAYCDQHSSREDRCSAQPGCTFLADGNCVLNKVQWLETNYGDTFMRNVLKRDAQECSYFTDAESCASRTYRTKAAYVRALLTSLPSLAVRNTVVLAEQCTVWSR